MVKEIKRTKDADGENFPVGSRLIPARLRPHVMAFYDYARTADDIADSTEIETAEKLERLNKLEKVLIGEAEPDDETRCAAVLKKSLEESNVTNQHALDLLKAFRQDSEGRTYNTWEDVMAYCRWSAGSVALHSDSCGDLDGERTPYGAGGRASRRRFCSDFFR